MADINLFDKYSDKMAMLYAHTSFVKGKTSNEYDWNGVESIKIMTPVTVPLNNYNRAAASNRYGTPTEMGDFTQRCPITQDKGFSVTIDKGNYTEQMMLKEAGKMMKAEVDEQVTPVIDKWAIGKWAANAGTVVSCSAEPTKTTIIEHLADVEAKFADAFIPLEDRFILITNSVVSKYRQAFDALDTITDRLLLKGVIGKFGTLNIVGIPGDWMPAGAYYLAFQRRSAILADKVADTVLHTNPPGISGHLLEGRYIYDAFVVGARAKGVLVGAASANIAKAPTATKGASTTSLASDTSEATIKYTLDGTDPMYSNSAITYSAAFANPAAGTRIRAVAYRNGMYPAWLDTTAA
jgi:hypothetical protein